MERTIDCLRALLGRERARSLTAWLLRRALHKRGVSNACTYDELIDLADESGLDYEQWLEPESEETCDACGATRAESDAMGLRLCCDDCTHVPRFWRWVYRRSGYGDATD